MFGKQNRKKVKANDITIGCVGFSSSYVVSMVFAFYISNLSSGWGSSRNRTKPCPVYPTDLTVIIEFRWQFYKQTEANQSQIEGKKEKTVNPFERYN